MPHETEFCANTYWVSSPDKSEIEIRPSGTENKIVINDEGIQLVGYTDAVLSVTDPVNNAILKSDGTAGGLIADSNMTLDGSGLSVADISCAAIATGDVNAGGTVSTNDLTVTNGATIQGLTVTGGTNFSDVYASGEVSCSALKTTSIAPDGQSILIQPNSSSSFIQIDDANSPQINLSGNVTTYDVNCSLVNSSGSVMGSDVTATNYMSTASVYATSLVQTPDISTNNGTCLVIESGNFPIQRTLNGNARGTGALDWQFTTSSAYQVASGTSSVIGGGAYNQASGDYSVVGGGHSNAASTAYSVIAGGHANTTSGTYSVIGGGEFNTTTGNFSSVAGGWFNTADDGATVGAGYYNAASGLVSTVCGGNYNTASGMQSTVGGGTQNTASGKYSTVIGGAYGVADRHGMVASSSLTFVGNGDAQHVQFTLGRITTNATPATLMLDGNMATSRLTIPSGKALFATVHVAGIINGGSKACHYIRKVAIKNVGGTTSLIGAVSTYGTDVEDDAAYDVTITADNTNDALDISVTGKAAETIRWTACVSGVEIAYG